MGLLTSGKGGAGNFTLLTSSDKISLTSFFRISLVDVFIELRSFAGPLICYAGVAVEFEVGNGSPEGRFAADLDFFSEISWEFRDEAKKKTDFLAGFNDCVLIVAVKLGFCVFEAVRVDFGLIFEVESDVDGRVADVFDLDCIFGDVVDGDIEVEL